MKGAGSMTSWTVVDSHVHLYDFTDKEVEDILDTDRRLIIVAVSDDPVSAIRTLELAETWAPRIVPCVGFHPWNIKDEKGLTQAWESARLALRAGVKCIGEVGVDRKFLDKSTIPIQLEIFRLMVRTARELDAGLNIHSPDAWGLALKVLREEDHFKAILHWYTGPKTLLEEMRSLGVYASINAAIRVQRKSLDIAKEAPLDIVVFESDGPYIYKGLKLNPLMTRDTVKIVAKMRGVDARLLGENAAARSLKTFLY